MAERRVTDEARAQQLQLVAGQLTRSPYAVAAADALIAWLLLRAELTRWALVWLAVSLLVSLGRTLYARHVRITAPVNARHAFRVLNIWFFAVGLTRIWPIHVGFSAGEHDIHYLVTMLMVGLAAGGVGTTAGVVSIFLSWAIPVLVPLAGAWISLGSFEGYWIAALLVLMFLLLVLYVRDYGRTLARQVELTEHLRVERDRADAERKRAEDAVVARTRFFAAASHDLRQPLGVLRWYGDAVTAHAQRLNSEPLLAIGEGIGRALARAEPLVRKYLDIARIDAKATEIVIAPCNVALLLERVREAFAREAQERRLQLRTEFPGGLAGLSVDTDEAVLGNIIDNLVGNALKFTLSGSVVLGARRYGADSVRVWVRDSGIGIAADEQERVFDDFYQVGNPERSHSKGVGLGLAIVRRHAELLGVGVSLRSDTGKGSTFELTLAASSVDAPLERIGEPQPPNGTDALKVLVIDDEPEVRLSLRLMLEAAGWEVATASGLVDALGALEHGFRADALIVDYRLSGDLTGSEVAAELRAAGHALPGVLVTGDTAPDRIAALAASGLPVLHKPVQGARLISTIREIVMQSA